MHAKKLAITLLAGLAMVAAGAVVAANDPVRTAYSAPVVAPQSAPSDTPASVSPQVAPASDRDATYTETKGIEQPARQVQQLAVRPQTATPSSADYSIYDAYVSLLYDTDADGYYHRFRVEFDADTYFFSADVYARLYLSHQGGPYYLYYTTNTFTIDGSASDDEYEVETTLTSGYPPGYYDVAIDLYEAGSHRLVARTDAYIDSDLGSVPLEDLSHEHGGSAGGASLFTGIVLLDDYDYDGYFHRFVLDIDVDLPHDSRLVYAQIDVRTPHGGWLHEHTTADFLVDGVGAHDILRVNADWESGYPPGRYDFRVRVYDAHTHALIVENGPPSYGLTGVPLEDRVSDQHGHPPPPPHQDDYGYGHSVSYGYGGSTATGWWVVLLLGFGVIVRLGLRGVGATALPP